MEALLTAQERTILLDERSKIVVRHGTIADRLLWLKNHKQGVMFADYLVVDTTLCEEHMKLSIR